MTDDTTPADSPPNQDGVPPAQNPANAPAALTTAGAPRAPYSGEAENIETRQSLGEKIDAAIANLADVTVATVITDINVTVDQRGRLKTVSAPSGAVPSITTNVNLVDGNVTTLLGPSIQDDATLTAFHQGLVATAVKVLPDNLKALAQLAETVFGKLTGKH